MFASMHARLANIAEEDNNREDRLGAWCPTKLELWLVGGHELYGYALVDGLNSVDDGTIDLVLRGSGQNSDTVTTVAIAHIVMLRHEWPSDADETSAVEGKRESGS